MDRLEAEKSARRQRTTEEITAALERSGLSRKEFAQRMHRVPSEVTRWLSGKHNFTSDLLAEISYVLGVSISGAEDANPGPIPVVDGYESRCKAKYLSDSTISINNYLDIPQDSLNSLKDKARSRGMSLREYIKDILTKTAAEQAPSANDFCGIWSDDRYPDAEQIRNYRTQNTFPEL